MMSPLEAMSSALQEVNFKLFSTAEATVADLLDELQFLGFKIVPDDIAPDDSSHASTQTRD